jgi:hypothetical protein
MARKEFTMRTDKSTASRLAVFAVVAALSVGACATPNTVVMVGVAHPPIAPADVRIYSHPPPAFEEIAILNASSSSMFTTGGQKTVDKVIGGLRVQAAKLGANGIILEGFSDSQTGSLGTGVGSSSVSRNSAVGVGVGGSLGVYKKTGQGRAIFVPPESATP